MSTFQKTKEDFVCKNPDASFKRWSGGRLERRPCNTKVKGDGYTNHCPDCLWSRHVDVFPGDRAEKCGGMMEPVRVEKKGREWSVIHKCQKCDAQKINKVSKEDNFNIVLKIASSDI